MVDTKYNNPNLNMALARPLGHVLNGDVEHPFEKYYCLKPGDVFVEVGAFWARYGILAQKRQCSKIVLIEAHPENAATIQNVINQMPLVNAILVNRAIGLERKIAKFVNWSNSASSRLAIHEKDYPEWWTDVEVDTLDNILTDLEIDHVDLLSSDCEGCEMNLVESAKKYLSEGRIKNIGVACYHGPENPKIVSSILERYNFKDIRYEEGVVYGHI